MQHGRRPKAVSGADRNRKTWASQLLEERKQMFTDYYLAGVMDNTTVRYTRLQLSHIRQATAQPMFTPQLDGRAHDPLAPSFIYRAAPFVF